MSYCRFTKDYSDVYIISHIDGYLLCYCTLKGSFNTILRSEMILHVAWHKAQGDLVPDYVIERLTEEIKDEGDEI